MGCGQSKVTSKRESERETGFLHLGNGGVATAPEPKDQPSNALTKNSETSTEMTLDPFKQRQSFTLAVTRERSRASFMRPDAMFEDDMKSPTRETQNLNMIQRKSRRGSSMMAGRGRRRMSSIVGDFSAAVTAFLSSRESGDSESADDQLQKLFNLLESGNGLVSFESLQKGFARVGWEGHEAHLQKMFTLADTNSNGAIDWKEFQAFFRHLTVPSTGDGTGGDDDAVEDCAAIKKTQSFRIIDRTWEPGKRPVRHVTMQMYTGCKERIKCVAASPSQRVFAVCDRSDSTMRLYDIDSGTLMRLYSAHQDSIMCVAAAPDRKHLATAGRDAVLLIWDITVGYVLREMEHPGVITSCCFSDDSKHIYTGCQDNAVRKFSVGKGQLLRTTERPYSAVRGVVVSVSFRSQKADMVAVSRSRESALQVVDTQHLKKVHNLVGHTSMVWSVSFSPNGDHLVSNCEEHVRVWEVVTGTCVKMFSIANMNPYPQVSRPEGSVIWTTSTYCSGDFGHLIAGVSSDNTVYFLHHTEGHTACSIESVSPIYCISASRDFNHLVCGDEFGNIYKVELH
eukprot:TRINITY_DN21245_c0_g1_i1.p1 TRINITY_DN21245_c0_g1~~TRINITY_DN21245_c0_g1_i1.p1  ORF type:complete len:567 (+),score=102.88 TRINITY_DN21245_c0_g1_i1:91-1791(+)